MPNGAGEPAAAGSGLEWLQRLSYGIFSAAAAVQVTALIFGAILCRKPLLILHAFYKGPTLNLQLLLCSAQQDELQGMNWRLYPRDALLILQMARVSGPRSTGRAHYYYHDCI